MILIISRPYETTILEVINWLNFYKAKFIVLDSKSEINFTYNLIDNKEIIYINSQPLNKFKALWYRNGSLTWNINLERNKNYYNKQVFNFLQYEWKVILDHFFKLFEGKKILGDYFLKDFNKLDQLILAKKCGLKVPNTIIATRSSDFDKFKNLEKITKPIYNMFLASNKKYVYSSYVKEITTDEIKKRENSFFPSLVQQRIERKIEIRIFFIKDKLYSMAIFNNGVEKVDIRDDETRNNKRCVPYILNPELKKNILSFIIKSKLTTGSIDMIVTPQNDFYFLEVNPIGQYDYLNKNCNFYIEREIANYLM